MENTCHTDLQAVQSMRRQQIYVQCSVHGVVLIETCPDNGCDYTVNIISKTQGFCFEKCD